MKLQRNHAILFLLLTFATSVFIWFASLSQEADHSAPGASSELEGVDEEFAARPVATALSRTVQPDKNPTTLQSRSLIKRRNAPHNVILLIGDGMGFEHMKAASFYAHGEAEALAMQKAPFQSELSTSSHDGKITDSAAAATAMATGSKVSNGVISISPDRVPLETSLEFFQKRCKSTGLVVTSTINHATPAAFAAHTAYRTRYEQIAEDYFINVRPNLLLGGGGPAISPQLATEHGYQVVGTRAELNALNEQVDFVSGQFGAAEMAYEYEAVTGRSSFYASHPHLSEMTAKALHLLAPNPHGFFLVIEGSRIDHAAHSNSIAHVIYEVLELDRALQTVLDWAKDRDDTLVLVTADHETGGLTVLQHEDVGQFPEVAWTNSRHTATPVPFMGWGPNAEKVTDAEELTDVYEISVEGHSAIPDVCDSPKINDNGEQIDGSHAQKNVGTVYIPVVQ